MRFRAENKTRDNLGVLMRNLGYFFVEKNPQTNEMNFIRSLSQSPYPRFHLYAVENKEKREIIFNLHLDQKRPIYKGQTAHSGEYEGELIEKEAERIKQVFQ